MLNYAAGQGVVIALEPEPDMLVDSTPEFERLINQNELPALRLTLDIGHLECQGETPIAETICRWAGRLANVHLDDMKAGVHEHLMFGEGEIDFAPVMAALAASGYAGGRTWNQPPQPRGVASDKRSVWFLFAIRRLALECKKREKGKSVKRELNLF